MTICSPSVLLLLLQLPCAPLPLSSFAAQHRPSKRNNTQANHHASMGCASSVSAPSISNASFPNAHAGHSSKLCRSQYDVGGCSEANCASPARTMFAAQARESHPVHAAITITPSPSSTTCRGTIASLRPWTPPPTAS